MNRLVQRLVAPALGLMIIAIAGCDMMDKDHDRSRIQGAKVAVAQIRPAQAATTRPTMNNVTGTVTFTQLPDGKVKVVADITGLPPNSTHGFHIHEKGDLSAADLSSAGGHYNPEGHPHAGPTQWPRHAGDFGNISSDANGNAHLELTVDNISLGGAKNDVIGKAVIVHAKADDLKSQPTGDAGGRVAGGIIQMNK